MLHSSVCISSAPTSCLVVRYLDGLIKESRKLQIHKPKESGLAKFGCAAGQKCSLRWEYRRDNDSRVTIMVSWTLSGRLPRLTKKRKTRFLVHQTDFGDDKLSGNERRITVAWFINFENVFCSKISPPTIPSNAPHFYHQTLARISAEARLSNIVTTVRERQPFSPKPRLNFEIFCS